jgi:hypothetical protein
LSRPKYYAVGLVGAFALFLLSQSAALADTINPGLYSIQSSPAGIPYSKWTVDWTQWLTSIPKNKNPAADIDGRNCGVNQTGAVWFLAGTFGGSAQRSCTIPSGKSILTPIISGFCTPLTDKVNSTADLSKCAREGDDGASLKAAVDGVELQNLQSYRVTSDRSPFTIPSWNPYGFPAGRTTTIVDGFWLFLKPLSTGEHTLEFAGSFIGNPTTGPASYSTEITYHLKVQ